MTVTTWEPGRFVQLCLLCDVLTVLKTVLHFEHSQEQCVYGYTQAELVPVPAQDNE